MGADQIETTAHTTPYEKYVRENIELEKKHLDDLYTEFAHSGELRKEIVKRRIAETNENIELLSEELEKYSHGLSWLREPSKERDEKAEHLDKIQEEPQAQKPAAPAAASTTAKPTVGTPRPSVGTPRPTVGTPRPSVGTPVGAPKVTVGTPVGSQNSPAPETKTSPLTAPQVGTPRPQVGTPISARPRIGTPKPAAQKQEEKKDETS